jgi:hypothetical protein
MRIQNHAIDWPLPLSGFIMVGATSAHRGARSGASMDAFNRFYSSASFEHPEVKPPPIIFTASKKNHLSQEHQDSATCIKREKLEDFCPMQKRPFMHLPRGGSLTAIKSCFPRKATNHRTPPPPNVSATSAARQEGFKRTHHRYCW